ncbi:conserved hypothetical protein [Frankia sp. Hr75.2]|nr:conserved hypothetical protein [Frankia sp. Hr75.2]
MTGRDAVQPLGGARIGWQRKPDPDEDCYPAPIAGRCNAKNRRPGQHTRCQLAAGWGTTTLGYGNCRKHLGNTENGRKAAAMEMYADRFAERIRFGEVRPVDPMIGLLDEVSRSAAFAAYLEQKIKATEDIDRGVTLTETTLTGRKATPEIELWRAERKHFASVCKLALDAGVEREQIDMITAYQERVLDLIEGVLGDLGLNPDDEHIGAIVTRHLVAAARRPALPS